MKTYMVFQKQPDMNVWESLRPLYPPPRLPLTGHAALVLMLQHVAVQHREAVLALAHQLRAERALQAVVLAARIRREGTSV